MSASTEMTGQGGTIYLGLLNNLICMKNANFQTDIGNHFIDNTFTGPNKPEGCNGESAL